jgi:Xaa-Pro dipeptidase
MIDPRTYRLRQRRLFEYLAEEGIDLGVIVDLEGHRNRSLRYLSGQLGDALLFLFAAGESLLVAWDVPLARRSATCDTLVPYEQYGRSLFRCIQSIAQERSVGSVELPETLPYPLVGALTEGLSGKQVVCRQGGLAETVNGLRTIKDSQEIDALRQACTITDQLLGAVPDFIARRPKVTELDLALFLEAEARRRGAEGMGFDTIAASPRRSFAIHCFPNFTSEPIGGPGLSIVDFGVRFAGYTSDVTLTLVGEPLSPKQQGMIAAVQDAYDLSLSLCTPGADPVLVGERIQEYFAGRGFHMPHSLGHGLGLDAHEAPSFRRVGSVGGEENRQAFRQGMVFTVEPGLYDPDHGGVRLENDLLCGEEGTEILTSARIVEL